MSDVTVFKEFYLKKIKELEAENRHLQTKNKRLQEELKRAVEALKLCTHKELVQIMIDPYGCIKDMEQALEGGGG